MDLERVKQLRNEYAEQHIISIEQLYQNLHKLLNQAVPSTMLK